MSVSNDDMIGKHFGNLYVLSRIENSSSGMIRFECRCNCGENATIYGKHLKSGQTTSCKKCGFARAAEKRLIDLRGKTIKNWQVLRIADTLEKPEYDRTQGQAYWVCLCIKCNQNTRIIPSEDLRNETVGECKCSKIKEHMQAVFGKQFGDYRVTKYMYEEKSMSYWELTCVLCGEIAQASYRQIILGDRRRQCSLRCREPRENLIGKVFGKIVVKDSVFYRQDEYANHSGWLGQCACGCYSIYKTSNLKKRAEDYCDICTKELSLSHIKGDCIYVLYAPEAQRFKVGFSTDAYKRISSIRTASPVFVFPLLILSASEEQEKQYHNKWSGYNVNNGEWYPVDYLHTVIELKEMYSVLYDALLIEDICQ